MRVGGGGGECRARVISNGFQFLALVPVEWTEGRVQMLCVHHSGNSELSVTARISSRGRLSLTNGA